MCGSGAVTASWDTQSSSEQILFRTCLTMNTCFIFASRLIFLAEIGKGVTGSGPIVLFNEDASTSVVISAYSNFMVHSQVAKQSLSVTPFVSVSASLTVSVSLSRTHSLRHCLALC